MLIFDDSKIGSGESSSGLQSFKSVACENFCPVDSLADLATYILFFNPIVWR